jgi:PAS domain S-box-containing protein
MLVDIANHWKTIVNTLQDGLMVVDPGGKILFMNPAAEQLTGYSARELNGTSCRVLNCTGCEIHGRGRGEDWCGLYAKGDVKAKKCLITDKNGQTVHVIKNGSVLKDSQGKILGAIETLSDMSELVRQQQEIVTLRKTFHLDNGYHGIVGESPAIQNVFEMIDNVSRSDAPVMIQGHSGTGKELVAHAIHASSPRRDQPFIKVNCAALNENLLESELFGHVKGAYTGAGKERIGRFEAADGGTIFLDEIGDIPLTIQVKLLRVLEEKEIERVGDNRPIRVDVRIVTATNKDLERLTAKGRFREDLYFRINVFPLYCPSLIERREDIPLLVGEFIRHNNMKSGKEITGLTPEAMDMLSHYHWPGNVRELRNAIEYAFVLCKSDTIQRQDLPPKIAATQENICRQIISQPAKPQERDELIRVLKEAGGNQSEAARILGVSRVTVWKRIRKYGIDLTTAIR